MDISWRRKSMIAKIDIYNLHTGKHLFTLEREEPYNLTDFEKELPIIGYDLKESGLQEDNYFLLKNDTEIFGIFYPYIGFSYVDAAEHDERVMIKRIFPQLTCHIIGE